MHPLLKTLDLKRTAVAESSVHELHPVRDHASTQSRGLPLLVALGLTPLLIYGLSISLDSPALARGMARAGDQARKSVSLLLQEPGPPTGLRPPVRNLVGPDAPGGDGHREGSDTIDPRLLNVKVPARSFPTEAIDPDLLTLSPRAEVIGLSLNPALPVQAGGNGLSRGTGKDPALGNGGLFRPQEPAALKLKDHLPPDYRLVPIRRQASRHIYKRGELTDEVANVPVVVRVVVAEDGKVIQATVLSGPEEMHADSLWAARLWLFETLGPHGLKAPLSVDLIFRPRFSN
jgi:hypothetical protein